MDMEFAIAERGDFVPYATAGDCYSAVDCPQVHTFFKFFIEEIISTKFKLLQGRFSVDLRGTGFRVSEKSVWQEDGHRTAKHVVRMKVEFGKLAGKCTFKLCNCFRMD